MTWSLRSAIKSSILNLYSDDGAIDSDSTGAMWTYAMVALVFIAYIQALGERYYFFYPKFSNVGMQINSDARKLLKKVVTSNVAVVVGIAIRDAIVISIRSMNENSTEVIFLWVTVLLLMILSIVLQFLWHKYLFIFEERTKGTLFAVMNAFDMSDEVENEVEEEIVESMCFVFLKSVVALINNSMVVLFGYTVSSAVSATLVIIYGGVYSEDTMSDVSADVIYGVWSAWLIVVAISVLILTYFARFIDELRKKRSDFWNSLESMDNTNVNLQLKIDSDENGNEEKEIELQTSYFFLF